MGLATERLFDACKQGNLAEAQQAIAAKAKVNTVSDWDHTSPLVLAAYGGHQDIVEALLAAGANPKGEGLTAITIKKIEESGPSIMSGLVSVLSSVASVTTDRLGKQAKRQRSEGSTDGLRALNSFDDVPFGGDEFDSEEDEDEPERIPSMPVAAAAAGGHLEIVKRLAKAGALELEPGMHEYHPLSEAASHGHTDIVKWLLGQGVEPSKGFFFVPPLHAAAQSGREELVLLFLKCGLSPDAEEPEEGYTPLFDVSSVEAARVLVDAGATVDLWIQGEHPVTCAAYSGRRELVDYLASL